jgi:protein-S-isoprenylcysteine O-methyltransferase Ste14
MEAEDRDPAVRAPELASDAPARRDDRPLDPESNERCAHHAGRAAVAHCEACDEPICISCATPVRGRVLGPGCVAAELGDPALVEPPEPGRATSWGAVAGALVAVLGTIGPWTRTGAGDRLFGAWVLTPRWSMLVGVASVALLLVAWRWSDRSRGRTAATALGIGAVIGSVLAILFPPTFQAASWGPWVTLAGAAIAVGTIWATSRRRGPGD